MTDMILTDTATVSGVRKTRQGFLVAQCRVAKAGNVQTYTGIEAGMPDRDKVRVYRPSEVVFDAQTMKAWAHKPITMLHPRGGFVTAENWSDEAVGSAGGDVLRDGEFVSVPMMLADAETIDLVERGVITEVSCGYRVALDATPGTTPEGEEYDAAIKTIVPDHLALVPKGRAGSECRFGDGASGAQPKDSTSPPQARKDRSMPDGTTERAVILVDGFTVETTNAGKEAIVRLQAQLADAQEKAKTDVGSRQSLLDATAAERDAAKQALTDALAAKDGEIAGLKLTYQQTLDAANARVAELESQTQPAALEAMATARAATVSVAKRYLGDAFTGTGLSEADIRKATVAKAMGPALADADAEPAVFFDSVFKALAVAQPPAVSPAAKASQPDQLRQAIASGAGFPALDAATPQSGNAYQKNLKRMQDAYKNPAPTLNGAH